MRQKEVIGQSMRTTKSARPGSVVYVPMDKSEFRSIIFSEKKKNKIKKIVISVSYTHLIPLKQVKNGIIQTSDNRFVKIVEVLPINFLLRSSSEQRSIILSFMSYLKIAPPNIQLKRCV